MDCSRARRGVQHAGRPPRRGAAIVCCAVAAAALAACGTSPRSASPSTRPTGSIAPPLITSSPSTTQSPTKAAVLAGYRAEWAAFEHALADANPEDPELAATMINPQLQGVKANLLADQVHGMVGRGTFTLHPEITSLSATRATIVDCAYSTSVLVYAGTGKPVPPITPPENDGVRAALVLTGGTWKVYQQTVTDGKCAPGS